MDTQITNAIALVAQTLRDAWLQTNIAVHHKTDGTDITAHDARVEELIVAAIRTADPHATIIGEEASAERRTTFDPNRRTYLVDPIDGTWHFAHGLSTFCTAVTRYDPDGTLEACVAVPVRGELWTCNAAGVVSSHGRALAPLQPRSTIERTNHLSCDTKILRLADVGLVGRVRIYGSLMYHTLDVAQGITIATLFSVSGDVWDWITAMAILQPVGGVLYLHGEGVLTVVDILTRQWKNPTEYPPIFIAGHPQTCAILEEHIRYR